eukprot:607625-Prymnesium_polylepis.1
MESVPAAACTVRGLTSLHASRCGGSWVGAAVSKESGGLASHLYEPCGCVPHSVTTLITTPGHWTA